MTALASEWLSGRFISRASALGVVVNVIRIPSRLAQKNNKRIMMKSHANSQI